MKKVTKYLATFIVLIILFILLLTLASVFPSSWIEKNVRKSSETLVEEGNMKIYFSISHCHFMMFDNYSDALMINTAYSIDNNKPFESAFLARKNYIPGVTKKVIQDFVGDLASNSNKYDELDQVDELKDTAYGEAPESYEYGRYWHGYLIFLRPLLILFDYWQIRILLTWVLALLSIWFLTKFEEQFGRLLCFVMLVALFEIDYYYIGLSLLNSPTILIMIIFAIYLLYNFEKIKDFCFSFFVMGCMVGFFCLLDFPLITYEMGIILYLLYIAQKRNYEPNVKKDILDIIKLGFFWVLGYFITWFTKWVLTDLIFNRGMIQTCIQQILFRTGGMVDEKIKVTPVLSLLLNLLFMAIPLLINFVVGLALVCSNTKKSSKKHDNVKPFLVVGVMPIMWLFIFKNHSFQHAFFVCKILFSTVTVMLIVVLILSEKIFKREESSDGKN